MPTGAGSCRAMPLLPDTVRAKWVSTFYVDNLPSTFYVDLLPPNLWEIAVILNERPQVYFKSQRRSFIGGSDARIIMGSDEAALLRLWREKRGEIEARDLSGDLL